MSSRSPPRARPLPLRDAAGRVLDSTRAAAASAANVGSDSTKSGGGRRASSTSTTVMASSSFDLRASSSSSPPSSSSPLSLLVRRLLSTPLAPCLAYGAISICITLFNKAVFSVYKFQFPAFVTALQVREMEEEREELFGWTSASPSLPMESVTSGGTKMTFGSRRSEKKVIAAASGAERAAKKEEQKLTPDAAPLFDAIPSLRATSPGTY